MAEAKKSDSPAGGRKVEIIIDRVRVSAPRQVMTVREILSLVNKSPDDWILTLVRDRRDQHDYEDPNEKVTLKSGMIFVTTDRGPKAVS